MAYGVAFGVVARVEGICIVEGGTQKSIGVVCGYVSAKHSWYFRNPISVCIFKLENQERNRARRDTTIIRTDYFSVSIKQRLVHKPLFLLL